MSQEKYNCPKSLDASVTRFPSLQCDMRACGGVIDNSDLFENTCKSCDKYLINAMKRDQEEIDRPL